MRQETRKLTKSEREELAGIVAWSTQIGRAVLFVLGMTFVAILFRSLFALMTIDAPVWVLPTAFIGYLLYRRAGRWTGGSAFRHLVRQDIEKGEARVTVINPVDVTEVEELEDEGPSYIVKTDQGDWVLLSGQELVQHKMRGFPWSQFSVDDAPHSGVFFGLTRSGDPVPVDRTIPPLSYELARDLGSHSRTFTVLDDAGVALLEDLLA